MAKYYYYDSRDPSYRYCTTTETTTMTVECGAAYVDTIHEGGDHTVTNSNRFTQRTLGIGPLGTGRGG